MMKAFFLAVTISFTIPHLGFAGEQQSCNDWVDGLSELTGALSEQIDLEREDLRSALLRLDELAGESCTSDNRDDIERINLVAAQVSDDIFAAENATPAERVLIMAILKQVSRK